MAAPDSSPAEMLGQLEQARKLALADHSLYEQIVPGILPVIGSAAPVEVRRWGADFIAEAFASPALPSPHKETLTTHVMPLLRSMIESSTEDATVVRSAVQASASIYPIVFRRIISHPDQAPLWQDMTAIKLSILGRMDSAPLPVRICCVKFLQKVVQVQTPGVIADPRRPEHNETSIALVPRNHPLLPLPNIEAETSGLLDRLLNVLQENSGEPLLIDATMNSIAVLIRSRPAVSNKIISAILNYNPLKHAISPMTPRNMVIVKSLERTTRALLKFVLKWMPNHPMAPKISAYNARLQQSRTALFSEAHSLKRPADSVDGVSDTKRQRLDQPKKFPPMPPPPHTFANLFTLTEDPSLQQFDVKVLPPDMVSMIASALMQHIDSQPLDEAIEEVQRRYQQLQKTVIPNPNSAFPLAGPTGIDDEDDYDPETLAASDIIMATSTERVVEELTQPILDLGPFELPKPPPLSGEEIARLSDQTIDRMFGTALSSERAQTTVGHKSGLNRLAASANDRDSWMTMMIRLATRAPAGLDKVVKYSKAEDDDDDYEVAKVEYEVSQALVPHRIREILFNYILEDWRHRLPLAISWLAEEWYADKIQAQNTIENDSPTEAISDELPNYDRWAIQLLDNLIPRFDANDNKILVRFLSELPTITREMLSRVKRLTRDPLTVKICLLALQYLYMMRPPVREIVIDTMQEIWQEGDADVKGNTGKILNKWKPGFVESATGKVKQETEDMKRFPNGVKQDVLSSGPMPVTAGDGT